MRLACPPLVVLLLALSACHPADTSQPAGTSNGTTPTSTAGGAPGTTTATTGVATPTGAPVAALPTDPNAASSAVGEAARAGPASAASR